MPAILLLQSLRGLGLPHTRLKPSLIIILLLAIPLLSVCPSGATQNQGSRSRALYSSPPAGVTFRLIRSRVQVTVRVYTVGLTELHFVLWCRKYLRSTEACIKKPGLCPLPVFPVPSYCCLFQLFWFGLHLLFSGYSLSAGKHCSYIYILTSNITMYASFLFACFLLYI